MNSDLETTLEELVDSRGLNAVLDTLADICHEKAEHIRCNWQDHPSSVGLDRGTFHQTRERHGSHNEGKDNMTDLDRPLRYALVHGNDLTTEKVAAYLPRNYTVVGVVEYRPFASMPGHVEKCVVISGRDRCGWTLDHYVIPRLGSDLMRADEIDLSHPVMMQLPAFAQTGGGQ
jgi:hypothetical protein